MFDRETFVKNEVHRLLAEQELRQIEIIPEYERLISEAQGVLDILKQTLPLEQDLNNEDRLRKVKQALLGLSSLERAGDRTKNWRNIS